MKQIKSIAAGQKSLIGRLLWPVNIVSFVLLSLLYTVIMFRAQSAEESALKSKADGIAMFLQAAGKSSIPTKDSLTLQNTVETAMTDTDFAYIVFYDLNALPLTKIDKLESAGNDILKFERIIRDPQGVVTGKVVIGCRRDRVHDAFWSTIQLGLFSLLFTQLLMSAAIYYFTSRTVIRPLSVSLRRLTKTTHVLSITSKDVSKFSEALSSGVNQQAEVVQQTTAAMTEMSSMLSQTSNYAKQSESVMTAVTQKANNGMDVMNQMVDAMLAVQQANQQLQQMVEIIKEIGAKTKVINDIVFKTQLLSFNASIEAARAGKHGRGFAVVAEEVGNLAKMSGGAAQEITSLLMDSEKQVNEIVRNTSERVAIGKSVTEQALKGFKDIANDINLISNQIGNISSATREQELGVAQTNQAMSELNKTTDLNGQIAQRANSTSSTLASEVRALTDVSAAIENSLNGIDNDEPADGDNETEIDDSFDQQVDKHATQSTSESSDARSSQDHLDITDSSRSNIEMPSEDSDSVADKIVAMARKQRADRKNRRSS